MAAWRSTGEENARETNRFCGTVIAMYYNDHAPPHFHVRYGEYEAAIQIDTGAILAGDLPTRVLALVGEWMDHHKDELQEDWELARARRELRKIEPLV